MIIHEGTNNLVSGVFLKYFSRNTIPQSAIGIDNNEQSDYLTYIQRKNSALDLRGQDSCSIFSDVGSKHI